MRIILALLACFAASMVGTVALSGSHAPEAATAALMVVGCWAALAATLAIVLGQGPLDPPPR